MLEKAQADFVRRVKVEQRVKEWRTTPSYCAAMRILCREKLEKGWSEFPTAAQNEIAAQNGGNPVGRPGESGPHGAGLPPAPFVGGDLHIGWGEKQHLVGDLLHAPVQRVGSAAAEVDQPPGQLAIDALQVDDHRLILPEMIGDLLCITK
jgi:hypothetical protein